MMRRAFVTGIAGQDGSYLAEQLLARGYEVHGLVRRSSSLSRERLDMRTLSEAQRDGSLHLHYGDVTDASRMTTLVREIEPSEIYNLAGQSHVGISLLEPVNTISSNGMGALNLLEAVRQCHLPIRLLQAGSSEIFRSSPRPISEESPIDPTNPYGVARAMAFSLVKVYRETHGLFAVSGLLFNHESPRRSENFVTRKISKAVAEIHLGIRTHLELGSIDTVRDWGYAPEYTDAMWRMLQLDSPQDLVLATGHAASVADFLDASFSALGMDWQQYVKLEPSLARPGDTARRIGDASKALAVLGWRSRLDLNELANAMVRADVERLTLRS